jgi:molybdopterin-guanine dinucleotide biosynthesis protein A
VRTEIFAEMLARLENTDFQCLVPVTPDGREQVLCAVYRKDALGLLDCGEARLRTAIRRLRVGYWHVDSGSWALNVNTPTEWDKFRNGEAL